MTPAKTFLSLMKSVNYPNSAAVYALTAHTTAQTARCGNKLAMECLMPYHYSGSWTHPHP